MNLQNDRVLAADKNQAIFRGKVTGKTAHPSTELACSAITSDGKTQLVSVDGGVKINKGNIPEIGPG